MRISMREAIRLAIREEMLRDPSIVVFGEDVAQAGGVFKVTAGLLDEFGEARVRDTPISEMAIVGAAVGAATGGLRPLVEIMFAEFFGVAMDQVVTELAKMQYLSRGGLKMPVVIRASAGAGLGFGAQHSETLETWFMSTPGLIVASPSGPRAAYGLTKAALRSDDPVILLEPRALYGLKEDFEPSVEGPIRLGTGQILRAGTDITIVALGQMVRVALEAADRLAAAISCEVIDLRTIVPWDRTLVIESAKRTRRVMTVEESPLTGGWGTEIATVVHGSLFGELLAPVVRVTCPDAPVPSGPLERAFIPSVEDVVRTVHCLREAAALPPLRWADWVPGPPAKEIDREAAARRRRALERPIGRFQQMCEIRAFEDAVADLFARGSIAGGAHTCQGQEAVAVGLAAATSQSDAVTCTYRGHGIALALGADPGTIMAEILGRRDGCAGGKGGSMHLVALEVGLLPTFAIVGAGIPVAAGAALARQVNGDDSIALAVFGDGAANIGAFHEAMNLAAVWRLPLVFVCENNLYGEYSPIGRTTAVADIASRATAYGMPARIVDGMRVEEVMRAVREAASRARTGGGPTLLEMKTYRYSGHSRGDPARYRPAEEVEQWRARDPLRLEERRLLSEGTAEAEIADAKQNATRIVTDAVAFATASAPPERGDVFAHIWSGSPGRRSEEVDDREADL